MFYNTSQTVQIHFLTNNNSNNVFCFINLNLLNIKIYIRKILLFVISEAENLFKNYAKTYSKKTH
ncbi:hypothetical protein BXU10_08145 [Flavobacterium sp. LM4]|nr:hypothetical protein BXU10_08145 [Flavobacterium sp. LM4]